MTAMSPPSSTVSVARRSLRHFAAGRLLSAIVGIGTLLLLVRALEKGDYGLYIALLAAFEILQLAASPGAYAVVFRYLPELREGSAGRAVARLVGIVTAYRLVTISLVAAGVALMADWLAAQVGVPGQGLAIRIYALVLVFEGMARFIDAQFESLLLQGMAQVSVLVRNAAKLVALAVISVGGSVEVPLQDWLLVEAVTTGLGATISCILMMRHLMARRIVASTEMPPLAFDRVQRFALPTYVSQVVGLGTGSEMVKLLVSKLVGTSATASFGFAAALSATLQRYLPGFLLVGWIRPLLITARKQGQSNAEVVVMAQAVLMLNLLLLAPVVSLLAIAGADVVRIMAGGRLPGSDSFLYFFVVLLAFQSVRGVVSLLGITLELGNASLRATAWSVLGLLVGLSIFPFLGIAGLCGGLMVSELIWSVVMIRALREGGMHFVFPLRGAAKLLFSVAFGVGVVLTALQLVPNQHTSGLALVGGALAALLCLASSSWLKPFEPAERELISRLLPRRLLFW